MSGHGSDVPGEAAAPVRDEIAALLRQDERQLGQVYRQLEAGVTVPKDIVAAGAAANTGAVSNLLKNLTALLDREIPQRAAVARQACGSIGWFLDADPTDETREYLVSLREELRAKSQSSDALKQDAAIVEQADKVLTQRAEELSGVYVYSFLHYIQYPNDDVGRCWLKVGCTNKGVWKRVVSQARQTSMPEDPKLLRIYHSPTLMPADIEARFHAVLDAAGHQRSAGINTKASIEWFSTTLDLLDALAAAMGLQIEQLELDSDAQGT